MGDRTYTSIRFSGGINRAKLPELIKALEAENVLNDEGDKPPSEENISGLFYDSECNYGQMETAEAAAVELGLSYIKTWEPGGGYGPGIEIYNALLNQTFTCATCEGEPVVGISELLKKPAGEIIPYLQMFANSEDAYPDLEIID